MSNSGLGYAKHPEHTVKVSPASERVRITFDGELLVDTTEALKLEEASYPAVYYVPRKDVKMELLERTTHSSRCPYKGDASYFTLNGKHADEMNAVWTYEPPFDEVIAIKAYLAFYPNKVQIAIG